MLTSALYKQDENTELKQTKNEHLIDIFPQRLFSLQ